MAGYFLNVCKKLKKIRISSSGFAEDVPYILALVELEEGVKMFTNLVDCDPREVAIGMAVEVTFVRANDRVTVPYFKPAAVG